MKTTILIPYENTKTFRETCTEYGIKYEIIEEGIPGDLCEFEKYELDFMYASQLYYIGQASGMKIVRNIVDNHNF